RSARAAAAHGLQLYHGIPAPAYETRRPDDADGISRIDGHPVKAGGLERVEHYVAPGGDRHGDALDTRATPSDSVGQVLRDLGRGQRALELVRGEHHPWHLRSRGVSRGWRRARSERRRRMRPVPRTR